MDINYAKYLMDKTRKDYNLIAEEFSRTRKYPWQEIKFLFDDYILPNDKVLDLGCGNGRYFEYVKNKKADYHGVDNSERLIEIAKSQHPEAGFQTADAFNLPFPDNFFDKVFSIAVLHHIPSKELRLQFLKEARRILKPGGLFVSTVWKFHGLRKIFLFWRFFVPEFFGLSKLDRGDILELWSDRAERYYHCFSKKELADLLGKAGFHVQDIGIAKNEKGNRQNIYAVAESLTRG